MRAYENGEKDSCFVVNANGNYVSESSGSLSLTYNDDDEIKIQVRSNWWQIKNTKEFKGSELKNADGIWVIDGEIYLNKPSNWID